MLENNVKSDIEYNTNFFEKPKVLLKPGVIFVRGVPGAGKTTLTQKLDEKFNLKIINPDTIKTDNPGFIRYCQKRKIQNIPLKNQKYRYNLFECVNHLKNGETVVWEQPFRKIQGLKITLENIKEKIERQEARSKKQEARSKKQEARRYILIDLDISPQEFLRRVKEKYKPREAKKLIEDFSKHPHEKYLDNAKTLNQLFDEIVQLKQVSGENAYKKVEAILFRRCLAEI